MPKERFLKFEVVDTKSLESREVLLPVVKDGPASWPVGPRGSGCAVEIDEPLLYGLNLEISWLGNHLILQGPAPTDGKPLPVFDIGSWKEGEWSGFLKRVVDPLYGKLYVRFDMNWLRIGPHILHERGAVWVGDSWK